MHVVISILDVLWRTLHEDIKFYLKTRLSIGSGVAQSVCLLELKHLADGQHLT